MLELNNIYNNDCINGMNLIEDNWIDLVITSPPYFLKKDYEKDWTWEKFDSLMQNVFKNIERILKPSGYFVLNFGDNGFGRNNLGTECISTYPMSHYYWNIKGNLELQATRIWRKQFAKIPFNGQAKTPLEIFLIMSIFGLSEKKMVLEKK